MIPSAVATPVTPATVSTSDASTRPRTSPAPSGLLKAASPRATASVPALTFANRSSNVLPIVSVSTSVPAMNATPSNTAKLVVRSRHLRAASVLMVVRNMASLTEVLHAVEHAVGGRGGHLVDDAAVGEEQ